MKVVLYGAPVGDREDWLAAALGEDHEVVFVEYSAPATEKQAAFADASAVVTVRYDLDLPDDAPLALIQVPGVGYDEIDLGLVPPGATVCNVYGHDAAVAEFAILQMLEWRHRSFAAAESFRRGSWERSSRFGAKPHGELFGSTVGIVGYGAIGRALAARLRPFGVRVLAANRSPIRDMEGLDQAFPLDGIERMFEACDFGVMAIALSDQTKALIGERELAALGPSGVIVNVARGPVIDEDALWSCLSDGRLGGAILDVWYRYPNGIGDEVAPSRHPLAQLPNVMATPHMSGWTTGTVDRRWAEIVENIRRVGGAKPFLNVVRPARK